jgi:CMP/dCMP kinase
MIIAVDGPAASGKGTLAAGLARHYGLPHLDTGLLYRAVGLAVARAGRPGIRDEPPSPPRGARCRRVSPTSSLQRRGRGARLQGRRHRRGARGAAQFQRDFATQPGGAVLDGRDIGTVVCPEADVKLFIVPTPRPAWSGAPASSRPSGVGGRPLRALPPDRGARRARPANPNGGFYPARRALARYHLIGYRGRTPRGRRHCRRGHGAQGEALASNPTLRALGPEQRHEARRPNF